LPAARVPVPTLLYCGLGKQARCVWPGHNMRRSRADLDVAAGTTVGLGCRCSRYAADNPAAVTLDHRFRMSGAQRSGRPEMFTWPSRHDELLYWSCSRIALGIRRRCRRSQTESTSARSSSARRRVIADARSWGIEHISQIQSWMLVGTAHFLACADPRLGGPRGSSPCRILSPCGW
jgi:hypothetical protein